PPRPRAKASCVWRLAFGVLRLASCVWRLAYDVRPALGVLRLAFGVLRLAYDVGRRTIGRTTRARLSAFSAGHATR
ncbi:MAG: hypothetical protein C4333_13300, partial [Meiothermus sp.]